MSYALKSGILTLFPDVQYSTHKYYSLGGATAPEPVGWEPGPACAAAQSQPHSSGAGSARGRPQKPASAPDRVSTAHRWAQKPDRVSTTHRWAQKPASASVRVSTTHR